MITNNVFKYYSVSKTMQSFGSHALLLPRYAYTLLTIVIMLVLTIVARNSLYSALSNLMAIIDY